MLQIQVLGHSGSMLRLPTRITKLEINPLVQDTYIQPYGDRAGWSNDKGLLLLFVWFCM
jgi:hypothetical protein